MHIDTVQQLLEVSTICPNTRYTRLKMPTPLVNSTFCDALIDPCRAKHLASAATVRQCYAPMG